MMMMHWNHAVGAVYGLFRLSHPRALTRTTARPARSSWTASCGAALFRTAASWTDGETVVVVKVVEEEERAARH